MLLARRTRFIIKKQFNKLEKINLPDDHPLRLRWRDFAHAHTHHMRIEPSIAWIRWTRLGSRESLPKNMFIHSSELVGIRCVRACEGGLSVQRRKRAGDTFHGESVVSVRPNGKNHNNETKIAKKKQVDIKSKTLTQSQRNMNLSNKGEVRSVSPLGREQLV